MMVMRCGIISWEVGLPSIRGITRPRRCWAYPAPMCVTYPGQVLEVGDDSALVEIDGRRRRASLLLVPEVAVGDWVIVATGTVLEIVDPEEATEMLALLHEAQSQEVG